MAARFKSGGRPVRGRRQRRKGKPQTQIGQMLQEWHQNFAERTVDFNALADSGDILASVIDNSGTFSNKILKWSKLKITWAWDAADVVASVIDARHLAVALLKLDEDVSSSAVALDSEEVVDELRRDGKLVRGPWIMSSPEVVTSGFVPPMSLLLKPITLRNFTMGREEDLVLNFTNLDTAFAATSQILKIYTQGFVREIA